MEAYPIFTEERKKELGEEAYWLGVKSKEDGLPQAVIENDVYHEFSQKNKIAVNLSGDIDLDIYVMKSYHNGYEGLPPVDMPNRLEEELKMEAEEIPEVKKKKSKTISIKK